MEEERGLLVDLAEEKLFAAVKKDQPWAILLVLKIRSAAKQGAAAVKAKVWTPSERRARSRLSQRLKLKPAGRWKGREWTAEQVALLGTDHDEAIARKIGRTRSSVTTQRVKRKIPAYSGFPGGGPAWTADEIALLGTDTDAAVAEKIGRTRGAVSQKRAALGVAAWRCRG